MYEAIVKLANKLDEVGQVQKAALLDVLIREAQAGAAPQLQKEDTPISVPPTPTPAPASTPAINRNDIREKIIFDGVLQEISGLQIPIFEYFLRKDIRQTIEEIGKRLEESEKLQKGSQEWIDMIRKIRVEFDELDPWNTSNPSTKIAFLCEFFRLADIVKDYIPYFNKPNHTEDAIIDSFIDELKKKGYLADLNKLKKSL